MKSIIKKSCALFLTLALFTTSIGGFSSVMLAKASDTSDVTMEDGVKYVKYEDISGYRTTKNENGYYIRSPKQSGYIFGGWFAEAGENSTAVTATSGAAWAKFVPEETFTIKGQISIAAPTSGVGFSDLLTSIEKVNLRLVTGVDSLKYQKVIFKMTNLSKTFEHEMTSVMSQIDVKHEEDSTYESKNASDVFGAAAEYFATIRITEIAATADRYLKDWTITPMVVTQDGTLVKGVTREALKISDAIPFKLEGSDSCITANYDQRKVTVNLTDGIVRNQFFATGNATNSSKYWEITGNLKVITGHVKGFTLYSADSTKGGFYTMWYEGVSLNQNWGWPGYTDANPWNIYNTDGVYVHSNADYNALGGVNVEKTFKAVIKDDVFSFWVEDKLVWELPLTDEQFGGFEPGTSYRFALRHLDYGGQAEWSNLKVKCEPTFLVANNTSGMTADRINGTVTANLTDGNVNTLCFGTDNATNSSEYWEITGILKVIAGHVKGFTLQSADGETAGFYTMWHEGISLNQNWGWPGYTDANPWNVYNPDGVYVHSNTDYSALSGINVEKRFKAVIKDDVFSFWVEDKLVWELPLTDERFGGFAAGTSYRFALRHLDYGGQAEWSDLKVKCEQTFLVADKTSGMTADCINGTVAASGLAQNLYFATDNATNSSENWEITGDMSQIGYGLKTISIKSTDGKQQTYTLYDKNLLVNAGNGEYGWYSWENFPEYVFSNSYYNSGMSEPHDPLQFKVIIDDDRFIFGVENSPVWSVSLTDSRFGGFAAGSSYQVAIGAGVNGQVKWSNLKVKYGQEVLTTGEFYIRDPFVLADNYNGVETYYMYGTRYDGFFDVFTSTDLMVWTQEEPCFVPENDFWGGTTQFYAPEVFKYTNPDTDETSYYMFATFLGRKAVGKNPEVRGTTILKADSPLGPFTEWSDGAVTLYGHDCLDGTLYIENGTPYMIYTHEQTCDVCMKNDINGSMMYIQLTNDLKGIASGAEHQLLFTAKDYENVTVVAEGPFVYDAGDKKYLLWAGYVNGYTQLAIPFKSLSTGIKVKESLTWYSEDGGHGMVFTDFNGQDVLILHAPNTGFSVAKIIVL